MNNIFFGITFIITGFITGFASGLLGIGGGVIFVPMLYILLPMLGIQSAELVFVVIATSLFAGSFASTGSFINHYKVKNVELSFALFLAMGSLISAIIVPRVLVNFEPGWIKYFLSGLLILVALKMLFDGKIKTNGSSLHKYYLFGFGLIIGGISAMTGIGGGLLYVPVLAFFYAFDLKRAIGTSSFVVAFSMIVSTISYSLIDKGSTLSSYQLGYINLYAGLLLGVSAFIGAKYGVKAVIKLPVALVRKIFAFLVIILVIKMLLD